jgi:hypothetical protein
MVIAFAVNIFKQVCELIRLIYATLRRQIANNTFEVLREKLKIEISSLYLL